MNVLYTFFDFLLVFSKNVSTVYSSLEGLVLFIVLLYFNTHLIRTTNRRYRSWCEMTASLPRPSTIMEMNFINRTLEDLNPYMLRMNRNFRIELLFLVMFLIFGYYTFAVITGITLFYSIYVAGRIMMIYKGLDELFKFFTQTMSIK